MRLSIDPHTNYFGVRASEDFDISMSLSLVGIGAVLQTKDEYTTVRELLAGSPAALSGKLKVGDRIVGVGQGANSPTVDVTGWRIDDAVALIRGAEDSVVMLDVLPAGVGPDGKHKLISLVRKKISLDKQAAKKSVLEVKAGSTTSPHRCDHVAGISIRMLQPVKEETRISKVRLGTYRACCRNSKKTTWTACWWICATMAAARWTRQLT